MSDISGNGSEQSAEDGAGVHDRDRGALARSAGFVGTATLTSRILGLVRDGVIAAFFRKRSTDAFFVAFTIPNVLRRLLAEGTLTVAFIPVFTDYRHRRGEEAARRLFAGTLGMMLVVLFLVCALGIGFAPAVVKLFAYGLAREPAKLELTVLLTRVLFPFLITVGLVALAMGALNTCGHFAAPAFAPTLLNICIIASVLLGVSPLRKAGFPPVMAIALGVLAGGLAQVLLQIGPLATRHMLVWPRVDWAHSGVRRVMRLMLPSVLGLAIYQLNVMLSRQFASFLEDGAISYIYYAQRLMELPIGIFAAAVATVAMPRLSSHASAGEVDELKATFRYALRLVLFLLLPATGGLIGLARPVVAVLFQRGQFSELMAGETAITLIGFAIGLCAAGGLRQTVLVFYALQDTRTPVKVAALSLLVYIVVALSLYRPLGTFGLALAVTASSIVNFAVLLVLLRRKLGPIGLTSVVASGTRAAVAAIVCSAAAWMVAQLGDWEQGGKLAVNYLALLASILVGGIVYVAACALLRSRELSELRGAFGKRSRA